MSHSKEHMDLRARIKVGDVITYNTEWGADSVDITPGSKNYIISGVCVRVYRNFCFVELSKVTECVNRWDIKAINGKAFDGYISVGYSWRGKGARKNV